MLRKTSTFLTLRLRQWIPDPFVFALLLTLGVGLLAWGLTGSSGGEVLDAWFRGFWILLEFGMQMVLVLATGYAIALSPVAGRLIDRLAARIGGPAQVYVVVLVVGAALTLVSWGWVVLTAVLARELAERVEGIDYAYLTACVYVSSGSWVCGLSSSIPLLLNTDGNFLIETGVLGSTIPIAATLGSALNLVYFGLFVVGVPLLMMAMRPRAAQSVPIGDLVEEGGSTATRGVAEEAEATRLPAVALSDRLNHGWLPQTVLALLGLAFLARYFATRGFDINLNVMIFAFLMIGLLAHRTPMRYVVAMKRACSGISGIVFQYPFYAGIMGLMMYTGLGSMTSGWLAGHASPATLPALSQLVGAAVNFAIPSAGGEWAVIGPGLVETARAVGGGLSAGELQELVSRVALAVAYGETSTNLLQPFFLLIILPVMGAGVRIQARDVMGYLVLPFLVIYLVTAALVTWLPM
jgi:short-chain fatty acids transporter